ncbi:MAG: DNA repair protein RadA [Clostridia bacterium]|nr:DNA repair protein RadA [Clostridia bacterium]
MKADRTYYECTECGRRESKWYGKCPGCGSFNTMEETVTARTAAATVASLRRDNRSAVLEELAIPDYLRMGSGMSEFDRVLGGGLVSGSAVLISGEPGIGKSTLLMQLCGAVGNSETVLYVSGEESGGQLKLRAKRLGVHAEKLYVLNETRLENILAEIDDIKPGIVIVDSIQTVYSVEAQNTAGSVTQVRECSLRFINKAKSEGFSVILVGHVNKEGGIAGPKVLEHMVDAVLYFEGERQHAYRIIRAVKNRYGSTNEIGVFEMTETGLCEVPNPSEALLRERPKNVSGSCAVCVMEGSRPLITEIQALVSPTVFPSPKRSANGFDYNRLCMLLAVLEKRLGLHFSQNDIYVNVTGGIELDEPAADLAVALALVSGILDRALPDNLIAIGEIGLSGECRSVASVEQRVNEVARLGFGRLVLPEHNHKKLAERQLSALKDVELHPVRNLFSAIRIKDMFAPKPEDGGNGHEGE